MRNRQFACAVRVLAAWLTVAATLPASARGGPPGSEERPRHGGRISGVVVSSVTTEPIAGAYVGVGDFGDASGTNFARFIEQGLYAHAETDEHGRFVLGDVAFYDHPLVVTHPEFVRHDEVITLRAGKPEAEVRVSLKPAAKIHATVVDASGKPLRFVSSGTERTSIRLEARDGRHFIHPGKHRHLSAFASPYWEERMGTASFSFTELDAGEYAIDVTQVTPKETTYFGGVSRIDLAAGETKRVRVAPRNYRNTVTLRLSEVPFGRPEVPALLIITRNPGLLVWDDGLIHHPEDHRLWRIDQNRLVLAGFPPTESYRVSNLPPGTYGFFVGPLVSPRGAKVEIGAGGNVHVEIPWAEPKGVASLGLWTLKRRVKLPAERYTAGELCALLTAAAKPGPRFEPLASVRQEVLAFEAEAMSLWDVLETIYLEKGWTVVERVEDRTLVVGPPSGVKRPAASEAAPNRTIRGL